jgi:hypothetical protein
MSRPTNRETARDLLAQAVIGLDNCTAAEHAHQSECLTNEGVITK